ncbi:MAG: PQQ-binding-like beta-propeller repeat protein [Planctomycetota bacterium]|jgi:outer membrane protein assembly factor BamB
MKQNLATKIVLLALLAVMCIGPAAEANWPRWRGPLATGVAPEGNPPMTWSETDNIKWKIDVPGASTSSPIIWEDKLFFQTAVLTEQAAPATTGAQDAAGPGRGGRRGGMSQAPGGTYRFDLVCLDRANGKILWQKTVRQEQPHEGHHRDHGYASYSPVTDGEHLWASFGSRGLHCFDLAGNLKWSKDLIKMETRSGFGEGSSCALAGDAVIVVLDHEGDSAIFAFDKTTGDLLWRKDRDERTSWATPVAVEVDGKTQVVTNATTFVRSYDAATGEVIWQCTGQTENAIPTPVIGFGKVFCTSGFRGSALQAIELGRTGDLSDTDAIAWQVNEATPYVPSPLLYGDRLYVCSGNNAVISCFQVSTGQPHYAKQRLDGIRGVYASPVGVADRVYFAGRNGVTVVIKNADVLEVLATNTLDDGFDASPAIVGDNLYLKGRKSLYCIAKQ